MASTENLDILADLIKEGKQERRKEVIKKAVQRVADADAKKPLENGPPIRRDVYQQLEWKALSITLVTIRTECKNCHSVFESPNSTVFVERYHKRHGRHLVEASNFNLIPKAELEKLPRRIETHEATSLYCHNCMFNAKEPLCLDPQLNPMPESSHLNLVPCVPQLWATPLPQTLWSDTFGATSKTMNGSSKLSEPSKPSGTLKDKDWL